MAGGRRAQYVAGSAVTRFHFWTHWVRHTGHSTLHFIRPVRSVMHLQERRWPPPRIRACEHPAHTPEPTNPKETNPESPEQEPRNPETESSRSQSQEADTDAQTRSTRLYRIAIQVSSTTQALCSVCSSFSLYVFQFVTIPNLHLYCIGSMARYGPMKHYAQNTERRVWGLGAVVEEGDWMGSAFRGLLFWVWMFL
ncbi:hypothetical protein CALCODRAFT_26328 [Calocera cornea HHB12733]|uniref:Uncharacterized protein n=1 Tax=Calocera cornea HHB12733 TaxID=1353952 RepID=A0A165J3F4_9BASI|nr:hypothetical protein CALCODRAFT_26328 [Calocera cornea HHB12733]